MHFFRIIKDNVHLIEMALRGKFVIQEFSQFTEKIKEIYEECIGITDGKVRTLFFTSYYIYNMFLLIVLL